MIMQGSREMRGTTDKEGEPAPERLESPAPAAVRQPARETQQPVREVQGAPQRTRILLARTMAEQRIRQGIYLLVGLIDAVVGLDFLFRLIAAANTGFAHLIFVAGSWLSGPFDGIFASVPRISGLTLRWSDLLVMVLATIIGWQVVRVFGLSGSGRRQRVVERVLV